MPFGSDGATAWLASALVTGSLQGGLAIALVWLVCRRLAHMPPSVEAALWWLATLKLLIALTPMPAISLAVLPAPHAIPPAPTVAAPPLTTAAVASPTPAPDGVDWIALVIALWIAGVVLHTGHLVLAYRNLRRIVGNATPIGEVESAMVSRYVRALGLERVPDVRRSCEIETPLVAGIRRPLVLVPADAEFGSEDLRIALCHELMHIRRSDLILGWVPALAERLFFFHPLARVAAREYITAREAACDAAVVRALGIAPETYGQLLVRLGIGRPHQALTAGTAPASRSSLKRRLDMLHRSSIARESRQVAWSLVVIAIVGLIPFRLGVKASPAPAAQTPAGTRTAPASPVPVREPISEPPNAVDGRRELAAQIEEHARALGTLRQAAEEITQGRTRDEAGRATEAMRQQIEELSGRFNPESLEAYVRETQDALRVLAEETAREQAIEARPTQREDTEAFLRAQIAELRARLEKVAKEDLERNADALEQFRRRLASDAQAVAAERRIAEEVRDRSKSLTTQLDVLREQQQALMRQMEQIAEQQKVLADMQQRIAEETQRLREALKPR